MLATYPIVRTDRRIPFPWGEPLAVLLWHKAVSALRARRLRKTREVRMAFRAHRPSSAPRGHRLAGA